MEVWIAPDLDITPAMRSTIGHYGFTVPDSLVAKGKSMLPVNGVPLRTVSRTKVNTPSGETRVVTSTMEYVTLSNAPLDASLFKVPADYQVMDMRKMMAKMPPGVLDSAVAKQARSTPCSP
jgi:hypothetical protein